MNISNDEIAYKNDVIDIYQELDVEIIIEILNQLKKLENINFTSQKEIKEQREECGLAVYLFAQSMSSSLNLRRVNGLKKLFSTVTRNDMSNFEDKYETQGKEFKVVAEQLKFINDSIKSTNKTLKNLGKLIPADAKNLMLTSFDNAIKTVLRGNVTFDKIFKEISTDLSNSGITFQDSLGRNRSIESVVRQELRYRVNECSRSNLKMVGKNLNTDGWQINITSNCRPTHQAINGKIFTNEQWDKYEHLIHDYNCNHIATPIFMFENDKYSQEEIDNANNKTVNYKGEKISYYDATQKQRALERAIRNAKKECIIADKTNFGISNAKLNLSAVQSNMRNFINETGLSRNYSREYFAGYNK